MEEEKKKKVMAEAAEFQPDAIELENHQPPVSMHFAWYIVILAILFLLGWACLTEVDKVVTAEGKITTIRPPITMKPLDRTTIRKVHVKVGQRVQKDELLFTFDQTVNQQEQDRQDDHIPGKMHGDRRLMVFQFDRIRLKFGCFRQYFFLLFFHGSQSSSSVPICCFQKSA